MIIRNERPGDIAAIRDLQYRAFKDHPQHEPGAEPTEHLIVDGLRDDKALTLSLVAEDEGRVVGHIAISPVTIGAKDDKWFILGPVGVLPEEQGKGIGSALVRESLDGIRRMGGNGMVLVGDPGFYNRFGFKSLEAITCHGVPQQYVLSLPLGEHLPKGEIRHHPAFG